jgi:hypothetical protein
MKGDTMKKITYDKKGIGLAELTWLSLYHPIVFAAALFCINHNMNILWIIRKVV